MATLFKVIEFQSQHIVSTGPTVLQNQRYEVYYDRDESENTADDYFVVKRQVDSGGDLNFGAWATITLGSSNLFSGNLEGLNEDTDVNTYFIDYNVEIKNVVSVTGVFYTFNVSGYFPYVERQVNQYPTGINDMEVSFTTRAATDETTSDGGINITVTGTNSPFQVALSDQESFIPLTTAQDQFTNETGVFGQVASGFYYPIVKDANGFTRTLTVFVFTETQSATPSDYGIIYYFEWGGKYRVDILKRDYSGSTTPLTEMGARPFEVTLENDGREIYESQILRSSCRVELVSTSFREWEEFINADDGEYIIQLSISSTVKGRWYMLPENIGEELFSEPYLMTLEGTDQLTDLESEEFVFYGFSETVALSEIIKECLDITNMDQGYRIVNSLVEDSDVTNSPFHTTYVNRTTYQGMTYSEVLSKILLSFNSTIRSWNGFWYIIRNEEWVAGTSVSYKEYTSAMVFSSSSSFNPVAEFKAPGSSSYWRWKGTQPQLYEKQYNKINLEIELDKDESGLLGVFGRESNGEWSYFQGNQFGSFGSISNGFTIQVPRDQSSNYMQKTGSFKHKPSDFISFSFDIQTELVDGQNNAFDLDKSLEFRGPYFPIKWSLEVGGKFLDTSGNWNDSETINQYFIENIGQTTELRVKKRLYGSDGELQNFTIKLYGASIFEYDLTYSSSAALLTGFRNITTTGLNVGARRIAQLETVSGSDIDLYYYELQSDDSAQDDISRIKPTDSSTLKWVLVSQWHYDHGIYSGDALYGAVTETTFTDGSLDVLPDGFPAPEEFILTRNGSDKNKRDLPIPFYHHDVVDISSARTIYKNFLKKSDGEPTESWTYDGVTTTIQDHFLRNMQALYSNTRVRVNASIYSDLDLDPLSVLKGVGDDNRIFIPNGLTFTYNENNRFDGDVIEYTSDNFEEITDFNNDDFNTNDYA